MTLSPLSIETDIQVKAGFDLATSIETDIQVKAEIDLATSIETDIPVKAELFDLVTSIYKNRHPS